jgi:flagellar biosynthesis/type III secretory pathway protein FliH
MATPNPSIFSAFGAGKQPPADGPARVVKGIPGSPSSAMASGAVMAPMPDWKAVPGRPMRGFTLPLFGSAGKANAATVDDAKLNEMRLALHKSEDARRHAAEEAKDEMVQMAKAALAEGMEKGRLEGETVALAKYEKQLAVLRINTAAALTQLAEEKAEAFLGFERLCLDLFSESILKVLGQLPHWNDEVVLPMLREAIVALGANTAITVRVNPVDFAVAKDKRTLWQTLDAAIADIRFESDTRIPKGGCLIESGATSASADPVSVGERIVETVRQVHQARMDTLRREAPKELNV